MTVFIKQQTKSVQVIYYLSEIEIISNEVLRENVISDIAHQCTLARFVDCFWDLMERLASETVTRDVRLKYTDITFTETYNFPCSLKHVSDWREIVT